MTDNQRIAIDRLSEYKEAKADIKMIKQRIQVLESRCNRITKSCDSIMQDSGQKDANGNKIYVPITVQQDRTNTREGLIDALMDMRAYYWGQCVAAERLCMEIEQQIYRYCSGMYARILSQCFLHNVWLEQIAIDEKYSYRQVIRAKWDALEQFGEKMSHHVT
jgi:hypothetical protein